VPELPDLEDYLAALRVRMVDATLTRVQVVGVSLLRTYDPPIDAIVGTRVAAIERLGKRLVWELEHPDATEPWFLVLHLMIAGRLRWAEPGAKPPGRIGLAVIEASAPEHPDEPGGTLQLTEAGTKRRASLHLLRGRAGLAEHDRGGVEPLEVDVDGFATELRRERRTLKRVLTDPRRFAGIGNAFSDEILHAAGLSPVRRTDQLSDDEVTRLHSATQRILRDWTARLRDQTGDGFPAKVTAFRDGFAVHGRFGQPCPVCDTEVQRIRYADNETNYCPRCQTDGRLLADRSLSRLLKEDWPRTVDALEGG
jgi:formamidopyrimidine-DNA glycosylase